MINKLDYTSNKFKDDMFAIERDIEMLKKYIACKDYPSAIWMVNHCIYPGLLAAIDRERSRHK